MGISGGKRGNNSVNLGRYVAGIFSSKRVKTSNRNASDVFTSAPWTFW